MLIATKHQRTRDWSLLALLWVVATGYNLFKPFHIDDVAHVFIAEWIAQHPLHPMAGLLNWTGTAEPISATNQPHLYFYLLAGWMRLVGSSAVALHLLQSLFTLLCIAAAYAIAAKEAHEHRLWLTAMLVLNPAFVVEQNLMVDVPLLSMWLVFFLAMLGAHAASRSSRRYRVAAFACSAAILIKYSSVVLVPIMVATILLDRRWRQLWYAAIPILALGAWSAFNLWDYGAVHILKPPASVMKVDHRVLRFAMAWTLALGALLPLGPIAAVATWRGSSRALLFTAVAAASAGLAFLVGVASGKINDYRSDQIVLVLSLINGAVCLACATRSLPGALHALAAAMAEKPTSTSSFTLSLWVWVTTAFYVLFAPFIAARHVLLVLFPLLLIVAQRLGRRLSSPAKVTGLLVTVSLSIGLGVSDWRMADFGKQEATAIARRYEGHHPIWTTGHLGWQFYAREQGIRQVDVANQATRAGDWLVIPETLNHQPLGMLRARWRLVEVRQQRGKMFNLFCTNRGTRFYGSSDSVAPWSVSRNCGEKTLVYQATGETR